MKCYFLVLGTILVVCVGCTTGGQHMVKQHDNYVAPPAAQMMRPGPMVDGPGPGVMMPELMQVAYNEPMEGGMGNVPENLTSQVRFTGPAGMHIGWMVGDGFAESQLMSPGRYNFPQAATYRLKFTSIPGPGREGMMLYPTLQVYPVHPTTQAYLMHTTIPIELNDEDFAQIESNNFVTKVIYLPEPKYQELAIAGVETLVSTRLEPGVDPVAEADRRGTILVVFRVGNMDLEMDRELQASANGGSGNIQQASYNGMNGEMAPPIPIAVMGSGMHGVPGPQIMGGGAMGAGVPAQSMIAGMGSIPSYGMPITGTPIGLPGPNHIPLGGPASLKSHTMRNFTHVDIGKPVDHMLMDVQNKPGYRLPHPVSHIEYSETHPTHSPDQELYPAWALPGGATGGPAPGSAFCP
ncbi:hypothetical protein Pla110_30650 [Polystyrenella longa]|uniref:Uncharacterized protein n=2 Tax=Polystyrenella longa TaxID=2528007 RepID=A0A518CQ46_9PLAN|nr:hypothetical protein Pla110_30650 [Polystyrenella longa]